MITDAPLLLDPAIRDWVVLPMVAIMVLMGLCRHYAQQLLKSNQSLDPDEVRHKQTLMRCSRLRNRGQFLPASSFHARKAYFLTKETGILRQKVSKSGLNPMANPLGMIDHVKGNMLYMLPNMVMMGIISYFFQGFVLVKVPFPLTNRFKVMLQRGVDLATLDVSYVSSLSWYFLVMFGLRGFFKILLGEDSDALDEARATQMQMGMGVGMGGGGGMFDAPAAYKHEREELEMAHHNWVLEDSELKLVGPTVAARISAERMGTLASSRSASASKKAPRVKKIRKKAKAP
ncbi:hypothetical protein CTAYLR_003267 [Chrysophaeum taylorii]|uniref:ER membrane protein complex subunit 3 n=1 Tax=Chrysophaeum taylorii TaxID=2483200 RepID=A0AAD7UBE4_9STRA|nr:hypothetical protein CTAYLR_003267 [Chrysophaeum taylorii]